MVFSIVSLMLPFLSTNASGDRELQIYEVCQTASFPGAKGVIHMRFYDGLNSHGEPESVCLVKEPIAKGSLLSSATVAKDSVDHLFGLVLTMSKKGQQAISTISRKYHFRKIAFVVNSRIILVTTMVAPIDGPKFEIRGMGQLAAERAAALLNGGP